VGIIKELIEIWLNEVCDKALEMAAGIKIPLPSSHAL